MEKEIGNNEPSNEIDQHLSFESALVQLQELVKKMESGALPLADSIAAYEHGMKLKVYLEQLLKEAELKIEKLNIEGNK